MGTSIGTDVLNRLFAPHGASAYFRRLRGTPIAPSGGAVAPAEAGGSSTTATSARRSTTGAGATTRPRNRPPTRARTRRATGSAAIPAAADGGTTTSAHLVTFAASGREAAAEGTLLETAEAAGLTPPFRCRRGICGTCTTPKLRGTVVDLRTGETSDAVGPIRLCVSEARSEVCLDL